MILCSTPELVGVERLVTFVGVVETAPNCRTLKFPQPLLAASGN